MELIMVPYDALPCALKTFTINGIDATINDFGEGYDHSPEIAEPYCCGCHRFDRIKSSEEIKKAMEKYNLTESEFNEICDRLETILYVGSCGWCS